MSSRRQERVNEILKREIAAGLYEVAESRPIDLSRVTVTGVEVSGDLRQALVHVSVFASDEVQQTILHELRHARSGLQDRISRYVRLKYTPHLRFVLDPSMAEADRVLQVMSELEEEGRAEPDGEGEVDDERAT